MTLWSRDPASLLMYDPPANNQVGKDGAWVMITRRLPAIVGGIDLHMRVGRVFFAVRDPSSDDEGFAPNGTYKVLVNSPWGDVYLWPHEYGVMPSEDVLECWTTGDLQFHPTGIDAARVNEVTFYARSRGLPLSIAAVMALGSVHTNIGWFEPPAELAEACERWEREAHRVHRRTTLEPMTGFACQNEPAR